MALYNTVVVVISSTSVRKKEGIKGNWVARDCRYLYFIPLLMTVDRHQNYVTYKM